ncbi:Gfo/Idh/MocA family oxidoreductase [Kribbella sp. NBC_01245]|uniref:Gfo/Idh/MocA family protein n=1 Tax=Kribbella sp. NBC_01245 TaxID=2903578 RepID=UPI002E2A6BB3|nr:Gfo/Idh/MocA family oxidoreductase [Kribbella sp. NBC_01245]
MSRKRVNVGIIGGGLMGREIAAAFGRWPALLDVPVDVRLTAVCDVRPEAMDWFDRVDSVVLKTTDYRDLLADSSVDVVYVAVRHDLHEQIYVDTIRAGKDLLAEKPFGIDLGAAERICAAASRHPEVFVRCSSEMPFYPGADLAFKLVRSGELGTVIEAVNSFSHSSDLDLSKPINWKRQVASCGAAGVMNDLGMHVAHVPLRLGWLPTSVYAVLQDLVGERPGPDGAMVPCDTIENATLLCTVAQNGSPFPLTLATKRIDPGQQNSWTFRVTGLEGGVEFSTRYPKTLRRMEVRRGHQVWQEQETGSQSVFPTVTGPIFEPGFSDTILQMWAAFLTEREGLLGDRFGCVTPDEALASHRLWTAALASANERRAVDPGLETARFSD